MHTAESAFLYLNMRLCNAAPVACQAAPLCTRHRHMGKVPAAGQVCGRVAFRGSGPHGASIQSGALRNSSSQPEPSVSSAAQALYHRHWRHTPYASSSKHQHLTPFQGARRPNPDRRAESHLLHQARPREQRGLQGPSPLLNGDLRDGALSMAVWAHTVAWQGSRQIS